MKLEVSERRELDAENVDADGYESKVVVARSEK